MIIDLIFWVSLLAGAAACVLGIRDERRHRRQRRARLHLDDPARDSFGPIGGYRCRDCNGLFGGGAAGIHVGFTNHRLGSWMPQSRKSWTQQVWALKNSRAYKLKVLLITHYSPSAGQRPPR